MPSRFLNRLALLALVMAGAVAPSLDGAPVWIWTSKEAGDRERAVFRKEFGHEGAVKSATLVVSCDNRAEVTINDRPVLENSEWAAPSRAEVGKFLKPGGNEIRIDARNEGGAAALLVKLEITAADGKKTLVESGEGWVAAKPGSTDWVPVTAIGNVGIQPWGNVLRNARRGSGPTEAVAASEIRALPGFRVERLYSVPKSQEGSWVSLAVDPKGRVLCCDQYGGLFRLIPPTPGATGPAKIEKLETKIGGAHGMLYAFDSLYVMGNEKATPASVAGLWRLRDTDADGEFDDEKLLRRIDGGGEHGPHAVVLSPDGKGLFIACGNHTKLPEPLEQSRPARRWDEDHLLPRMWDARGHATGILAPGGYVCRTDPEGKSFELFCHGFRNAFDIAFDAQGELFTFDSDMEWDMGAPWYRPTRIIHCVSGADYGWRSGSGKWPVYYPDNLPGTADIGPGSPTGVTFGTGAKFPAKYQAALFANDWTFGTMYAVHLRPNGATFAAEVEEFLSAKPLPLSDVVINPHDGAMYFAIGGRKTQSGVYRVTHESGGEPAAQSTVPPAHQRRRALEAWHSVPPEPRFVDGAWPQLADPDRYVRYAARVVIERQAAEAWAGRLWAEKNATAVIEGAVAMARVGPAGERDRLIAKLESVDYPRLTTDQKLGYLRAWQLVLIRMSKPPPDVCGRLATRFDSVFPSNDDFVNRELCQLLVYLDSPRVVAKSISLMATARELEGGEQASADLLARNEGYAASVTGTQASRPNRQQIALAWALRSAKHGWTPELHRQYFAWFAATKKWRGGNSFAGFLDNARKEALALVGDEALRAELAALSTREESAPAPAFTPPKGPGRPYSLDDVVQLADGRLRGRNFESGKNLFAATACLTCHRFNGDGGGLGPDLTGAGNRYSLRDLVENIVDPSKVISDQYGSTIVEKKDGSVVVGRIMREEGNRVSIASNPLVPNDVIEVNAGEIAERRPYPLSMMPPSLLNSLNDEEVLDLLAYIQSGGNPNDPMFHK